MFNRDFILVIALVVIALLCFPILGLLVSDFTPASIAQARATSTPIGTSTPAPHAYLLPFRQVFAIGQSRPISPSAFLLYENGTDVFQLIEQQGAFARLQTLDGKLSFWTAAENVSMNAPTAAQYDFSGRGKTIRLIPSTGYACLHEDAPPPTFSTCQSLPNFSSAKLTAKITSGPVIIYLVEIDNKNYYAPPDIVLSIP
jgi:hypothetical protein